MQIHQIQSGQIIIDICSVVKELVENSIDAGATSIDVRVKNQGLDLIEVQDNGSGISAANHASLALKHHTSKLSSYSDIASLRTFGFRGEALASLCALSRLTITTCVEADVPRASRLTFEPCGQLAGSTFVAAQRGTTVSVQHLFHSLPVRRRQLERSIKREWHKAVALLGQYACIQTRLKFSVFQQPSKGKRIPVFSTQGNAATRDNIINIFGARAMSNVVPLDLILELQRSSTSLRPLPETLSPSEVRVAGFASLPSPGNGRQISGKQMLYINGRPCHLPQVVRIFNDIYRSHNCSQSPFIFADLQLDPSMYDVNVSPDKRTILLHDQSRLLDSLRAALDQLFVDQEQLVPASVLVNNGRAAPINAITQYPSNPAQSCQHEIEDDTSSRIIAISEGTKDSDSDSTRNSNAVKLDDQSISKPPATTDIGSIRQWISTHQLQPESLSRSEQKNHFTSLKTASASPCEADVLTPNHTQYLPNISEPLQEQSDESNIVFEYAADASPNRPSNSTDVGPPLSPNTVHRHEDEAAQTPFPVQDTASQDHETTKETYDVTMEPTGTRDDGPPKIMPEPQPGYIPYYVAPLLSVRPGFPPLQFHSDASESSEIGKHGRHVSTLEARLSSYDMYREMVQEPAALSNTPFKNSSGVDSVDGFDTNDVSLAQELTAGRRRDKQPGRQVITMVRIDEKIMFTWMEHYFQHRCLEDANPTTSAGVQDIGCADAEKKLGLVISKQDFHKMRIVGQFNLGFIIAVRPAIQGRGPFEFNELLIIDQHASDEKYNFERLQKISVIQSQQLMQPKKLRLTALEEEIVVESLKAIEANGFKVAVDGTEIAPVGSRCRITALPLSRETNFGIEDLYELIALLGDQAADSNHTPRPSKVRKMLASRACRSSIMIGKALTFRQMRLLVRQMGELDKPWNCPHGRPTMRYLYRLESWGFHRWNRDEALSPLSSWKSYARG